MNLSPLQRARRLGAALLVSLSALAGCTRDHSRITPSTGGTDLRHMPRGRMTPLPFPGSSLALVPASDPVRPDVIPKSDPATQAAANRDRAEGHPPGEPGHAAVPPPR